jgi:hypothetical protein
MSLTMDDLSHRSCDRWRTGHATPARDVGGDCRRTTHDGWQEDL